MGTFLEGEDDLRRINEKLVKEVSFLCGIDEHPDTSKSFSKILFRTEMVR